MSQQALEWAGAQLGRRVVHVEPLLGGSTGEMLALTDEAGGRSVLRLVTVEPWRTHGAELTARESRTQQQLVGTAVPAPRSIALDAGGAATGDAAHLMSLLPGAVDLDRVSDADLATLARVLADIHAVRVDPPPRLFQPWAWEEKYVVPSWAADPDLWERSFELLRAPQPAYEPTFLHRDFAPRNVLWDGARVSGVVDWVEASTGPAWLDVAHCCTNLALDHGNPVADRFATAYAELTRRDPDPWWDVLDVVGFLPRPGAAAFTDDPVRLARLEGRLQHVLTASR